MSLRALETATQMKSILPRALVVDNRSIAKGQNTVFYRDAIYQGVKAICGMDASIVEEFETALLCASNLTNIHREMALRGLKAYLFGGTDHSSEARFLGVFSPQVMIELFETEDVSMTDFQTIQNIWDEFTFPTNGGRFAPIGECFILGDYPMSAITPGLMMFDKATQDDEWTPVPWVTFAESFLNRDQASDESAEHDLKVKHILADMINAVKIAKTA